MTTVKLTDREIKTLRLVTNTPGGMYFGLTSSRTRNVFDMILNRWGGAPINVSIVP